MGSGKCNRRPCSATVDERGEKEPYMSDRTRCNRIKDRRLRLRANYREDSSGEQGL